MHLMVEGGEGGGTPRDGRAGSALLRREGGKRGRSHLQVQGLLLLLVGSTADTLGAELCVRVFERIGRSGWSGEEGERAARKQKGTSTASAAVLSIIESVGGAGTHAAPQAAATAAAFPRTGVDNAVHQLTHACMKRSAEGCSRSRSRSLLYAWAFWSVKTHAHARTHAHNTAVRACPSHLRGNGGCSLWRTTLRACMWG